MKCRVPDCEGNTSKGSTRLRLCGKHYLRWTRFKRLRNIVNRGSGWTINTHGYVLVDIVGGRQYEHIVVAEKALGKPLPKGAIVHHIDGNKLNNSPTNLVICPSQSYHIALHRRMKSMGF